MGLEKQLSPHFRVVHEVNFQPINIACTFGSSSGALNLVVGQEGAVGGRIIVLGSQEVRERRKRLHEQIKHVLVARSEFLGGLFGHIIQTKELSNSKVRK